MQWTTCLRTTVAIVCFLLNFNWLLAPTCRTSSGPHHLNHIRQPIKSFHHTSHRSHGHQENTWWKEPHAQLPQRTKSEVIKLLAVQGKYRSTLILSPHSILASHRLYLFVSGIQKLIQMDINSSKIIIMKYDSHVVVPDTGINPHTQFRL